MPTGWEIKRVAAETIGSIMTLGLSLSWFQEVIHCQILLSNGQNVIHKPIKDKSRREIQEKKVMITGTNIITFC